MSDPFLGEIEYFAFNFPPKGWVQCAGQLLPVNQNQALFSLLGTTFGGDGKVTFGLPDLRGRVAVGQGTGPGRSTRTVGQTGGEETHALTTAELPAHTHPASVVAHPTGVSLPGPAGNFLSVGASGSTVINAYATGTAFGAMSPTTVGPSPGAQAHANIMPYLALNPCIALVGIYPLRS